MASMDIYFKDLNPDAQARYLLAAGVSNEFELNHEILPIAIVDFEPDDSFE